MQLKVTLRMTGGGRWLILVLCLVSVAGGYLLGRTGSQPPGFAVGSIAGDDTLEQAWENLLHSQREALDMLRASEFYGDDQERAEAYQVVLADMRAEFAGASGSDARDPLMGLMAPAAAAGFPHTPNTAAGRLSQMAAGLYQRSVQRLAQSRAVFALPRNSLAPVPGASRLALGQWDLDNDTALMITLEPESPDQVTLTLGNVWAMALAAAQPLPCENGVCSAVLSHRDPGRRDWLDTGGRRRGILVLRGHGGESALRAEPVRFDTLSANE